MMSRQVVWVNGDRCTGCGACVEACPVEAMVLVDDRARVSTEVCTGCGACVDICPQGAIEPLIEGELVPVSQRPSPAVYRPGPLAEAAGSAVAVAGVGLMLRGAEALLRALGRRLTRWTPMESPASRASSVAGKGAGGGGRRARRRRRGG